MDFIEGIFSDVRDESANENVSPSMLNKKIENLQSGQQHLTSHAKRWEKVSKLRPKNICTLFLFFSSIYGRKSENYRETMGKGIEGWQKTNDKTIWLFLWSVWVEILLNKMGLSGTFLVKWGSLITKRIRELFLSAERKW